MARVLVLLTLLLALVAAELKTVGGWKMVQAPAQPADMQPEQTLAQRPPDQSTSEQEPLWVTSLEESQNRTGASYDLSPLFRKATAKPKNTKSDITLILQTDRERLTRATNLPRLLGRWKGPVSLAVLTVSTQADDVVEVIDGLSSELLAHLDVHLVKADKRWAQYPANMMRNIALSNSKTDWVFLLDIGEDVSASMERMKDEVQKSGLSATRSRAFVMPSFQWRDAKMAEVDQLTEVELGKLISENHVSYQPVFQPNDYRPPGFLMGEWLTSKQAIQLPGREEFSPYMVARKDNFGLFDTRFVGARGSYTSLTNKLQLEGWRFVLLPHVFTFNDDTTVDSEVDDEYVSLGLQAAGAYSTEERDLFQRVMDGLVRSAQCGQCADSTLCFHVCPRTKGHVYIEGSEPRRERKEQKQQGPGARTKEELMDAAGSLPDTPPPTEHEQQMRKEYQFEKELSAMSARLDEASSSKIPVRPKVT